MVEIYLLIIIICVTASLWLESRDDYYNDEYF